MRNVTITLDEELARWIRVRAAEQDKSVSRFISEALQRDMLEEKSYEEAMKRFFSRKPSRINDSGVYPKREELYGYLLTEDLQHGQDLDGVRVVNPFTIGPTDL